MKKLHRIAALTCILVTVCGEVSAQDMADANNHFDILGLSTSVNVLRGKETRDTYLGGIVAPELRYRYGKEAEHQWYVATGWVGLSVLSNAKDGQQAQVPERTSYRTQEIYGVVGFSIPLSTGSESALKRFGCGVGWSNLRIGKSPEKYDSGATLMCSLQTNGMFTSSWK